jgi:hypothetical protein
MSDSRAAQRNFHKVGSTEAPSCATRQICDGAPSTVLERLERMALAERRTVKLCQQQTDVFGQRAAPNEDEINGEKVSLRQDKQVGYRAASHQEEGTQTSSCKCCNASSQKDEDSAADSEKHDRNPQKTWNSHGTTHQLLDEEYGELQINDADGELEGQANDEGDGDDEDFMDGSYRYYSNRW